MNKRLFVSICILFHIFFAFFQIYKRTTVIRYSYEKQKIESELAELIHQKKLLSNEIESLKNRSSLKDYAKEVLFMEKIKLSTIKKISL